MYYGAITISNFPAVAKCTARDGALISEAYIVTYTKRAVIAVC